MIQALPTPPPMPGLHLAIAPPSLQSASTSGLEWAEEVLYALRRLDAPLAQALRAVYFAQMSCAEAAAHLGIPLTTFKTRLAAGLSILLPQAS
jgi:DNA-directed RNA polymerase specialized sigma24 family protein